MASSNGARWAAKQPRVVHLADVTPAPGSPMRQVDGRPAPIKISPACWWQHQARRRRMTFHAARPRHAAPPPPSPASLAQLIHPGQRGLPPAALLAVAMGARRPAHGYGGRPTLDAVRRTRWYFQPSFGRYLVDSAGWSTTTRGWYATCFQRRLQLIACLGTESRCSPAIPPATVPGGSPSISSTREPAPAERSRFRLDGEIWPRRPARPKRIGGAAAIAGRNCRRATAFAN